MRILLLTHSFNSLTQRLHVDLRERGHDVSVEFDINEDVSRDAVALFRPDVILAPFLKRAIPADIWGQHRCLIVHPGPVSDRGPSALDWAILQDAEEWGVTVLEAQAEMDAGPVWASARFAMRQATKSSLYRREVTRAAVEAVAEALARIAAGDTPTHVPLLPARPLCRQADRAIDWSRDTTQAVLRKIRSADGTPGVRDVLFGRPVRLFDAHPATGFDGRSGSVVARCGEAVARITTDGAVWIGHVRLEADQALKLPATQVFAQECASLPSTAGLQRIFYEEEGDVGFLHFSFLNGAMAPAHCAALRVAYAEALKRPTRVLVLMGGPDYWSNGIHLGQIEAADSPADESWRAINAIDDLAQDILATTDRLVVSALRANAGAGGVFLALAADEVWADEHAVLNPHYKDMGNLYGSEYWTYVLPHRLDGAKVTQVMAARLPMGASEALRLGLVDRLLPEAAIRSAARAMAADIGARVDMKRQRRARDEVERPLQSYRDAELSRMRLNFYGFDPSYHVARYNFVHKVAKSRTPLTLAKHRRSTKSAVL
ncbi:MAG: hydrogenase maturation protein [Alphaproteobacteria bacterium]|nr:hydrogenase maturation protein [Alphaproteobacteria bacterium]